MLNFVNIVDEVRSLSLTRAARPVEEVERGEDLAARKAIYERLHPETKAEEARKRGLKQGDTRPEIVSARGAFSSDTASKTGLSDRTIWHEVQGASARRGPRGAQGDL